MSELLRIAESWEAAKAMGTPAALLTVVRTRGSTYRKAGAHMLVTDDGSTTGMISGGCLDRDLLEHARSVIASAESRVVSYDTTRDDAVVWGVGAGCRGTMDVLIEPLPSASAEWLLAHARRGAEMREAFVAVTVARCDGEDLVRPGARRFFDELGAVDGIGGPLADAAVLAHVEAAFREKASRPSSFAAGELLVEYVPAPVALVIFGAGEDAEPVARIASTLGWDVTVADHRPAMAVAERFPGARVIVATAEDIDRTVATDARTAVVLMTHNYERDLALLNVLLRRRCAYLGILGPRARADQLMGDVTLDEDDFDPYVLDTLHAPVGLDIGSRTPEEIALALVAEIQKTFGGGEGISLRDKRPARAAAEFTVEEP